MRRKVKIMRVTSRGDVQRLDVIGAIVCHDKQEAETIANAFVLAGDQYRTREFVSVPPFGWIAADAYAIQDAIEELTNLATELKRERNER